MVQSKALTGHWLDDAQGHFQIMFNPKVCPLFQSELSWGMRLMYCSGVWSYVVAAISTPFLMLVPVITIWIGVFPVIINRWAALGLTIYAAATQALLYYVRTPRCAFKDTRDAISSDHQHACQSRHGSQAESHWKAL